MSNTKKILIGLGVAAIIVGGLFGIKYYNKKKNQTTKEDFDSLVKTFDTSGKDVFKGLSTNLYEKAQNNFIQKITKTEYEEIKSIASKNEKDWTTDEKIKILNFLPKLFGVTNPKTLS